MDVFSEFSEIAVLLGEPARIKMLWHLLGGELRPAGELAFLANVSAQSASMHLAKLVGADLLTVSKQGRYRFYSITRPEVANVVESMAGLLPAPKSVAAGTNFESSDFRRARSCYDHLAGQAAVELAVSLQNLNVLTAGPREFSVTEAGEEWFAEFGIDVESLRKQRRLFAKKCLDWSERRHHIAGALGAAMLKQLTNRKWLVPASGRTLRSTLEGRRKIEELFGIRL